MNHIREKQPRLSDVRTSCGREVYILLEAPPGPGFMDSLQAVMDRYESERNDHALNEQDEVYLKFHVSDMANQDLALRRYLAGRNSSCLYSICGQPPSNGSKIALEAYLMRPENHGGIIRKDLDHGQTLQVIHGAYESLWMSLTADGTGNPFDQSSRVFRDLKTRLKNRSATMSGHLTRTWIYVRDIDHNYRGLVDARRQVFEEEGLTDKTHFVASTGIGAEGPDIHMDALSMKGLTPGQVHYLKAPEYLCPTSDYGVTFERGTALTFGDRKHGYISGTASIDHLGQVLFPGSAEKQSDRILQNMEALLKNGGMTLNDLKYLIVYLRDPADGPLVRHFLMLNLPVGIPMIMLKGFVCRPAWLVEMEGVAAIPQGNDSYPPFF